MPVDLSVSNAINSAYAQGRQESFERQKRLDQLAQKQKEEEDKAALLAEQQKEFTDKQRQDAEQFKAEHELRKNIFNLQQTTAAQDFSKYSEQTGNPAQGFTPDLANSPIDTVEVTPGEFVPRATLYKNEQGLSYTARSPQVAAKQQAEITDTLKASDRAEVRSNMLYDSELKGKLEENSQNRKFGQEDYLNATEFAHTQALRITDYRHDLDMQLLRNEAVLGKAGAGAKDEFWDKLPLNPTAQDAFGLPKGSTWADAVGEANLEPAGKKQLLAQVKLEPLIIRVQEKLGNAFKDAKTGQVIINPATGKPMTGYDRYFQGGITGALKDAYNKLVPDTYVEGVRPDLGEIFVQMKELGNFGAALTKNEAEFMRTYTPGAERTLTPERAQSLVNHLLKSNEQGEIDTVMLYGSKKGKATGTGTAKTTTQTPRVKITIDAEGNITDRSLNENK